MNTTPEERPSERSHMVSVFSHSVRVTFLDRAAALKQVKEAVRALAQRRPEIERVILFGSLATGRAVPGSDADLLVLLTHSHHPFLARIPLYRPEGCQIPVDVFPYTQTEREEMQASGNVFLKRALAEGIEIFPSQELVGEKGKRRFFAHLGRVVGIRSVPAPHMVTETGLMINAMPHSLFLSDRLLDLRDIVFEPDRRNGPSREFPDLDGRHHVAIVVEIARARGPLVVDLLPVLEQPEALF